MGRQQKAAKMTRKKDQLSELPDGIISIIISMLTLKEAVRTSVLSNHWRFIWTSHAYLWFDSANVLGSTIYSSSTSVCQSELERQLQRCNFIERVNKFMDQRSKGTKIDSFAIHFHLGKDSAPQIDQWISCAMIMGVETIDLDLSESCSSMVDHVSSKASDEYKFPFRILAVAGKKCDLRHLRLASCSLIAPPDSNSLTSLITIQLLGIDIKDEQLGILLSSCLFLEGLSLHLCNDLVNLKFAGPNLPLKDLNVQYCFRLQRMELCAKNLVLFEYTGHLISFYFKIVPRLADCFLNFTGDSRLDGATYAMTRFISDLPQLKTLNLLSVLAMKMLKLPETVPTFTNIKQLVLTIFPFDDEDKLCWISYVLKAFPLLQKLQLNLFCPSFIKQPKEIERVLPECPHSHVGELEINGFYGNQHEEELLKYLLDNLVELKVLVVSPCQKVYRGFNNWVYEEANAWYKFRMERVCGWLHAVVPPTVHLRIR
ncbi:F-box/FBD/LRR-repeat protein At1g13570-like [Actinidia eriantha]|uniref:F-box/FBD/LRR-repeat protein At1g13570-like n=1 Tax=Actinidia eriantha TaxID=165200 RepID=UPI002588C1FE|nr:F-box/FBD/LRR-repeat protein At1g13570-like [Actinidia eriantha]